MYIYDGVGLLRFNAFKKISFISDRFFISVIYFFIVIIIFMRWDIGVKLSKEVSYYE